MIIINSGAYVIAEFQAEFGKIPPSLLPIGNKTLLEHQVANLRESFPDEQRIVVSLPEHYELTINESHLLTRLGLSAVFTPENFTLAESVLYVLNTLGKADGVVRLLHGDTLIGGFPLGTDLVAVAKTRDDYGWQYESVADETLAWCGFFCFSSARDLIRTLTISRGQFTKAVRIYEENIPVTLCRVDDWFDLGHINTYFRSRSTITTQRAFNELTIRAGVVMKSGSPSRKIQAEANWIKSLPVRLKRYVPQIIEEGIDARGDFFYATEYLALSPLNEIFVHGRNPESFWQRIFFLIRDFLENCRELQPTDELKQKIAADMALLCREKTRQRLSAFAKATGSATHHATICAGRSLPSLEDMAEVCIARSMALPVFSSVMHGDFCFSNILLDSRSDALKVIDPRGMNELGEMVIAGDQKYDLAKLAHSVLGLYDFIIAGRYQLLETASGDTEISFNLDARLESIQKDFLATEFLPGFSTREIMPLVVLLFLSMLPLHADRPDRQRAMKLNAIRLYSTYLT